MQSLSHWTTREAPLLHFLLLNVSMLPNSIPLELVLVLACALAQPPQRLCLCFSSRTLSILFVEIDYWERLLFETPHYVVDGLPVFPAAFLSLGAQRVPVRHSLRSRGTRG